MGVMASRRAGGTGTGSSIEGGGRELVKTALDGYELPLMDGRYGLCRYLLPPKQG